MRIFVEKRLEEAKINLAQTEENLKDFQMRSAEVSIEKQIARAQAIRLHKGN